MGAIAEAEVRAFMIEAITPRLREIGHDPATTADDLDLLEAGIVDSLGLLELIAEVEDRFSLEIDFEGAEPEELSVLGALSRRVAEQGARAH